MNIEVHKKRPKSKKSSGRENILKYVKDLPTDTELKKEKEKLEVKEKKEAEKQSRKLCAEYHKRLDKTKWFDTKAMQVANELEPKFKKLLKDKSKYLSEPVLAVVTHRYAYLKLMATFGKSKKIKAFIDEFKPTAADAKLFEKDPKKLEAKVKKSKTFQALDSDDLLSVIEALKLTKNMLVPLKKKGTGAKKAAEVVLMDPKAAVRADRIDDFNAAKRMHGALKTLIKNLKKLRRKKQVFEKAKAKPKSKKKAA